MASIGASNSVEPLLHLAGGRAFGRIAGEQLADQVPQGRAVIEPGAAGSWSESIGPAGQQPGEQGPQAVEVGRADGSQAAPAPHRRERRRWTATVAGSTGKPNRGAGEVELRLSSVDQEHLAGTEPAVGQSQSMGRSRGAGQVADQLHRLVTGLRPVHIHRRCERRRTDPFQDHVGRVVRQPELEHADRRRMLELGRQAEPRSQPSPTAGSLPRRAHVDKPRLPSHRLRPRPGTRSRRDRPQAGPGAGSGRDSSLTSNSSGPSPPATPPRSQPSPCYSGR